MTQTPCSFQAAAARLSDSLGLTRPPVAVAFADEAPEGVALFEGSVPGGCRFWQEAMTRVFATVPRDHSLCAIGIYTHGLESGPAVLADLEDALKVFGDLGYVRPGDMAFIPVLQRAPKVVVYGPLASIPVPPDVVLLFAGSERILILAEASQQLEDGLPAAMGRPACAALPQAFNTGRSVLSLGCCGARAYLDAMTPDLAMYAVPGARLEDFTARVEALARANTILRRFHAVRRQHIEAGERPSVQASLSAMG